MNKTVDRPWIAQAWLDAPIRPAGWLPVAGRGAFAGGTSRCRIVSIGATP
jgi:hypothetical protein